MIKVLDHGYVRLVSYMQPVPYDDDGNGNPGLYQWTGDLEIVRNARTSYNADWRPPRLTEDKPNDAKLIHYLYEHEHTTPFEAMVFTFEVQAPIFVFRQWHRHRTWSYNEVSARYTELPDLFYIPALDQMRPQSRSNKQGREMDETIPQAATAQLSLRGHSQEAHRRYKEMLEMGIARELARLVLPVNTYSRMFATVDLHNLFHFLELRLDPHAQFEIRVYADALLRLITPICPVAVDAFCEKIGYTQGE